MIPRLDDPRCYREVLDDLTKKWSARGRLDRIEVDGVTLADVRGRTGPLAAAMAKTVASGAYQYSPLRKSDVSVDGKIRTIHRPNLLDRVVLMVLARYLTRLAEPFFSETLHSYRKGRSPWKAIASLQDYLQEHRRRVPLRERGLFVLRRDVRRYGESIPTESGSRLWPLLERVMRADADDWHRDLARSLVVGAVRHTVLGADGVVAQLERGIPTGSPIQPPCTNLYLTPVDEFCTSISGAHYARFGDDVLFCHPEPSIALAVSRRIDELLDELQLQSKPEKRHDLDFNGAGRRRSSMAEFRPCNDVEYLGVRLDFAGNIGIKREKALGFERGLRARLRRVARLVVGTNRTVVTSTLCEAVRVCLDTSNPLAMPQSLFLRYHANQRGQLRDLDYRVALMVAEIVAQRRGRRAFRSVSYRELRRCGLPSLVLARRRVASSSMRPKHP